MRKITLLFIAMAALALAVPALAEEEDVFLSDLVPLYENNVHQCLRFDTVYWQPDIVIDGVIYEKGLGMHAPAPGASPNPNCTYFQDVGHISGRGTAAWKLDGAYEAFLSRIALSEQNGAEFSSDGVIFRVYLDGQLIYDSGVVLFSTPPIDIARDISGGATLVLEVDARSSHFADHSVWANARLRPGVIEVSIDIKPGSFPNSINRKSKGNVPVALLSARTFDATTVDHSTVSFAGTSPLDFGKTPEDVNGDGLLDVVFHFATESLNLSDGTTEVCLTGKTTGGTKFKGCDSVNLVK